MLKEAESKQKEQYMPYESFYIKFQKIQMNLSLQKADQWLPKDGGKLGGRDCKGAQRNFEG